MADPNESETPLEAAADVAGARTIQTFSLLGNETRLAILLALWEAWEPFVEENWDPAEGNAVPFQELRERVARPDADQLTYHLAKLEGEFIEQTAEGYRLLPAGNRLVRSVVASAGFDEPALDETEIGMDCHLCGEPAAITYRNNRLYIVCTNCEGSFDLGKKHPDNVLSAYFTNPTILRGRSPEEIYAAIGTESSRELSMEVSGVCPACSGQLDLDLDVCLEHDSGESEPCSACGRRLVAMARISCTVCKYTKQSSLMGISWHHPAVVGLAWKHGIELGFGGRDLETNRWLQDVWQSSDIELVETEHPRVRVTIRHDGDEVQLTYDETLEVVEVTEDY